MTRLATPVADASAVVVRPLTVLPGYWDQGIARRLLDSTMALFEAWGTVGAVAAQGLGDTVLVGDGAGLQALAICHAGAGSEAGSGNCYVKFGAVRPGPGTPRLFGLLVDACKRLAADRGAGILVAGANAGREQAWRALVEMGFRRDFQGVTMHRPNESGYSTANSFVIDDWR